MAADFKLLLMPEITRLVSIDGEPAAVALAVPNLNEMVRRPGRQALPLRSAQAHLAPQGATARRARASSSSGIRKKWRNVRKYAALSAFLYAEMNEGGRKLGIREGELGWTLEDNGRVNAGIQLMGAKLYKKYRVYEKPLTNGASST